MTAGWTYPGGQWLMDIGYILLHQCPARSIEVQYVALSMAKHMAQWWESALMIVVITQHALETSHSEDIIVNYGCVLVETWPMR